MKYKRYYIVAAILIMLLSIVMCLDYYSPRSKLFRSLLKRGVDISFKEEDGECSAWYWRIRSRLGLFSTLTTPSMVFSELDLSGFDFNELRILHEEYHVGLPRTNLTDSQLKTICQFKNIRALDISGCKNITDEGIREIANLENLRWLDISNTNCTDAGVVLLKDMPKHGSLRLDHTRVDGSCFDTNDGWQNLRVLDLHACKYRDDIFDLLSNIDSLEVLYFSLNENNELPPNIENLLKNESFVVIYIFDKNLMGEDVPEDILDKFRNRSKVMIL